MRDYLEFKLRKILGWIFSRGGKDGHNLLCRSVTFVCNYGPSGTFCYADHYRLNSGGSICTFGSQCGDPTEDYTRQMFEQLERFHLISEALQKSGGMMTMVMENPSFSAARLCTCNRNDNSRLPEHNPLCGYRAAWDMPVTIEEYKEALESVH